MKERVSSIGSIIIGLVIASVFLYFAFRETDVQTIFTQISEVTFLQGSAMALIYLIALLVRGYRWHCLLPEPHRKGEMHAAQRALAISYGVNNVASRIGELIRLAIMKRDTGRDLAGITASVVADRIFFDFLIFASMIAYALAFYSDELLGVFPQLESAAPVFVSVTLIGMIALVLMAAKTVWFKHILAMIGLKRFPTLWEKLETLMDQLGAGLAPVIRPRKMIGPQLANIFAWILAYLNFAIALSAFGIQVSLGQGIMIFTVASLGMILPSPGGMGTFHYFMTEALVRFAGAEPDAALAAATVCHGVNFLVLMLAACVFFFWKPAKNVVE